MFYFVQRKKSAKIIFSNDIFDPISFRLASSLLFVDLVHEANGNNEIVSYFFSHDEEDPAGFIGLRVCGILRRSAATPRHPERSIVSSGQGRGSSFHGNRDCHRQGRDESVDKKAIREDRQWNERVFEILVTSLDSG